MFCSTCGTFNPEGSRFCDKCGAGFAGSDRPNDPPRLGGAHATSDPRIRVPGPASIEQNSKNYATGRSGLVALALSFFIPGAGQLYNGDAKKGATMFVILIVSFVLLSAGGIGAFGVFGVWIWSMIDAYNVATGKSPLM